MVLEKIDDVLYKDTMVKVKKNFAELRAELEYIDNRIGVLNRQRTIISDVLNAFKEKEVLETRETIIEQMSEEGRK